MGVPNKKKKPNVFPTFNELKTLVELVVGKELSAWEQIMEENI